ncbi:DNA translocase FtsK [Loigolactobacillus binensis]|uniref:DNA translocase FtsK n=1 Tax=Loigolactobacillus binensis TaxID=2559922 RepID=A0ABW3E8F0_9LACO|nr:DNA translocase FtsK [Loigolactobacillus binensis]
MAARKKPRRKRTSTASKRRKTTARKSSPVTVNVIGFIFILLSLLAIFKWGFIGNQLANILRIVAGDTFPVVAGLLGLYGLFLLVAGHGPTVSSKRVAGVLLTYFSLLCFLDAVMFAQLDLHSQFMAVTWRFLVADFQRASVTTVLGGGMLGAVGYSLSYFLVGQFGTYLLTIVGVLGGLLLLFDIPFTVVRDAALHLVRVLQWCGQHLWAGIQGLGRASKQLGPRVQKLKKRPAKVKTPATPASAPSGKDLPQPVAQRAAADTPTINVAAEQMQSAQAKVNLDQLAAAPTSSAAAASEAPALFAEAAADQDYKLPNAELLQAIPPTDQSAEYTAIKENTKKLKQTFDSFGIDVEVKNVNLGPAVTKYEIKPAIGVKVSKIVSLTDDLALALAAKDVRIEAPIPGKSLIGIEVPNKAVATVSFRDVFEAQPPHPGKILAVPVGRDISGNVIMVDISKMPHLLIAGSTGSGKSVMINDIIIGLLMTTKPHEVKLMMIDPKKVELSVYNGVPHLLTPVVTDAKKAAQALHKVVAEMERRYELFAQSGKRNITEYNQAVQQQDKDTEQPLPAMPYIVAIVDELADLMMVSSNEVEDAIVRLAQMGRAAGIHMILATQRPSVDVITGLIKANVPSRMAFAVSSGIDSRTIIDSTGAEKLLGRGDMLYLPMGQSKPTRVQGAFIAAKDVEAVVSFITAQQTAEYDDRLLPDDQPTEDAAAQADDELFPDAVKLVAQLQTASISMLQRRFRIGYNRAARIVDEMEQRGIVGPAEGSKPRKVYVQNPEDEAGSNQG